MRKTRGRGGRRAFTIAESLLGFVIVLIALGGLFAASSFGAIKLNAEEAQAVAAGQQYLDQLRDSIRTQPSDAPLPAAPVIAVDPGKSFVGGSVAALGNFTIVNDGCPTVTGSKLFRKCTVTVTWSDQGTTKTRTMVSYATQQI